MILLISKSERELSTEIVMDWLDFFNAPFVRMNGDMLLKKAFSISLCHQAFEFEDKPFNLNHIRVIWYRRWMDNSYLEKLGHKMEGNNFYNLRKHLISEANILKNYLFKHLSEKQWIDTPSSILINKLDVLNQAYQLGVKIPDTIVTNEKKRVSDFLKIHKKLITKTIGEVTSFNFPENELFLMETKLIDKNTISNIPTQLFYPSLFQQFIDKKYDIRSFYLDGKFYSMAIFSQNREESKVDFRNYNLQYPNRRLPFKLPEKIEQKLLKLVKSLDLKHCSIDLALDKKNQFYFFEINPVGQFGMVSFPCNYFLEQKLAEFLKHQNETT